MDRTAKLFSLLAVALAASTATAQQRDIERDITTSVVEIRSLGRGFLGVQLTPLTPELRVHFGAPEDTGVMVAKVERGGPAEAAGIEVGDIIASIDGERIASSRQIARAVRAKEEGDLVNVELYRDRSLHSYSVTVGERDRQVVDLAEGYRFISDGKDGDGLPGHDVVVRARGFRLDEESVEALEHAMQGLEEHLGSAEWRERIERLNELDFTTIEERMQEVERRLQQLEKELEREDPDEN